MPITKPMEPFDPEEVMDADNDASEIVVEIANPDAVSVSTEEGGIVIDFDGELSEDLMGPDHESNLAEFMDEQDLQVLASDLVSDFIADRESRKEWARAYVKGLDLLGLKIEERQQPWAGASGVFHPLLTEAIVRFQAQAMSEMFPPSGPVRTKIVGKLTTDKYKQSQRVESELNYLLTEEMTEYRDETEQMLFKLPLAGSAFKKVYYDPIRRTPCRYVRTCGRLCCLIWRI
jgi:hypothetical protein